MPRRWNKDEIDLLVELVAKNYEFLTGSINNSKTKAMVDKKWSEIASSTNSIGAGPILGIEQVRKKWFDTKSLAKKAVAEFKKESSKTGGGVNTAATPSELQFKIASLIGPIFTVGIPGTEPCDTTGASISSNNDALLPVQPRDNSVENLEACSSQVSLCFHSPDTPAAKRSKTSKREQQNEEMIDVEQKIQRAVSDIRDELRQTNNILSEVITEMKVANETQQQLLATIASYVNSQQQQQQHQTNLPTLEYHYEQL